MTLNIFNTQDEALDVLAQYFVQLANEAIEERDCFTVALSGGHTPQKLYKMLASAPYKEKVTDWSKIYFFFGDERYVPHTDADSNYRMAKEAILEPLGIAADHIFPMDTALDPEAAAAAYQQQLNNFYKSNDILLDLVLMGLGEEAHTASLFPHTAILKDKTPAVKAVWLADKQTWRITLNAPMINDALHIAFLVFGKEKAQAMQHVFSEELNTDIYPAQLIRKKRIAWFTDTEAAALIPQG